MNKKVVYTALTKGYDSLIQHSYVNTDYDYICFSNDFNCDRIGIWEIRKIPFEIDDVQRMSRYPKLQPYKVLKEYDYSLYVDANIDIIDDYIFNSIEKCIKSGIKLAGLKHQLRDCIYEESLRVILTRQEKNISAVLTQMSLYKKNKFPFRYGMYEANVIFRMHNDVQIMNQCNTWWYYQTNYSRRDQLSYSYTLWKSNIHFNYLLPTDEWSRNSSHVLCFIHKQIEKNLIKRFYFKFLVPGIIKIFYPVYQRFII